VTPLSNSFPKKEPKAKPTYSVSVSLDLRDQLQKHRYVSYLTAHYFFLTYNLRKLYTIAEEYLKIEKISHDELDEQIIEVHLPPKVVRIDILTIEFDCLGMNLSVQKLV
jgi:hypothetical protein